MITFTFDNLLHRDGEPFLLSFLESNVCVLIVLFKLLRLNTGCLFDYSLNDPLILTFNPVSLSFLDNVIEGTRCSRLSNRDLVMSSNGHLKIDKGVIYLHFFLSICR
jgi:hypothetical protein